MASSNPAILSWLKSAGIWWDESLIDIRAGCSNCSGPALGVHVVSDIAEDKLLCVIPFSAILSPRTTQLAAILEAEKLGGGLALTIAVMFEASLGAASKWAGYFASLPKREYLPLFWSQTELQLLAGTALEAAVEDDRADTEQDYQQHVAPLITKHPEVFKHSELCSLEHFRVAASWVASRSFHVDAWHGDAMLPLADIFNHKASLVLLGDNWRVAEEMEQQEAQGGAAGAEASDEGDAADGSSSDGAQDDMSGQEKQEQEAGSDESDEDDEDGDEDAEDPQHGFAVGGMPLIAAGAAAGGSIVSGAAAGGKWLRDGINLRLEIGICSIGDPDCSLAGPGPAAADGQAAAGCSGGSSCQDHSHCTHADAAAGAAADEGGGRQSKRRRTQQPPEQQQQRPEFPEQRLEIIAASAVPCGREVHNTYGELSNAELVHKYGFCLPANPFDELQLAASWSQLLQELAAPSVHKKLAPHIKWLRQHSDVLPGEAAAGAEAAEDDDQEEEEEEEGVEPPAALPGGRVKVAAAAVLRLLGAPAAKLSSWSSLQEVLQDGAPAAAAAAEDDEAATAVAEHFDDMRIASRDLQWWGHAGLELLLSAVQARAQRYPGGGFSIEQDEAALQQLRSSGQLQQQGQAGEHAAAMAAALQLRVCEQRILKQLADAAEQVLAS